MTEHGDTRSSGGADHDRIVAPAGGDEASRDLRAERRRDWPVRKFRLGEEPGDNLGNLTTPEERLAMMWPLAVEAWSLAGRPLPRYARGEAPVAVLRRPASLDNSGLAS